MSRRKNHHRKMEFSHRADLHRAHPQALISDYIGWPTPPQLSVSAPLSTPYWVGQLFFHCFPRQPHTRIVGACALDRSRYLVRFLSYEHHAQARRWRAQVRSCHPQIQGGSRGEAICRRDNQGWLERDCRDLEPTYAEENRGIDANSRLDFWQALRNIWAQGYVHDLSG